MKRARRQEWGLAAHWARKASLAALMWAVWQAVQRRWVFAGLGRPQASQVRRGVKGMVGVGAVLWRLGGVVATVGTGEGRWKMEDRGWRMEDGGWKIEDRG